MMDYWAEAVEIALSDAGVETTEDQRDTITGAIEGCHENYGQAQGHDVASANLVSAEKSEIARLKRELETAREGASRADQLDARVENQSYTIRTLRTKVAGLKDQLEEERY